MYALAVAGSPYSKDGALSRTCIRMSDIYTREVEETSRLGKFFVQRSTLYEL